MIAEIINACGKEILAMIVAAIAGYIGVAVKNLVAKYLNDKTKRAIAKSVVQFVEQVYKNLHGEDKLNAALATVSELLAEKGISFSEYEMKVLIEAAVAEFNGAFNKSYIIQDGIAVEDMTDDQLRSVFQQMGFAYTESMTRDEMLAALDEETTE